jgi:hypothetical protein
LKFTGEVDVFAEESIPRVHSVDAGFPAGSDYGANVQVALSDRGGADPHRSICLLHMPGMGVSIAIHSY